MISRFIIKTNKWYERLPTLKGSLFYIGLIFIPYLILTFTISDTFYKSPLIWIFLVALWRTSYFWILDYKKLKIK